MGVYKCPVCEGRGVVPADFYWVAGNTYQSTTTNPAVTCRSCGGKGVIFDSEVFGYRDSNEPIPEKYSLGSLAFFNYKTCSNCAHNDGMVYTSNPPKWKCTLTNEWHEGDFKCDNFADQALVYGKISNLSNINGGITLTPLREGE